MLQCSDAARACPCRSARAECSAIASAQPFGMSCDCDGVGRALRQCAMFQTYEAPEARQRGADRVARLRRALAERGLDAVLVPRADEHQGEYVPPSAERLKWLTGFTGSAGLAAVARAHAALFVDGRYVVQAP